VARTLISVGLHLEAGGFPERLPGDADSDGARPAEQWQLERRRPEQLAEGALSCPECELPIAIAAPLAVSEALDCPYCERHAPARDFLRLGAAGPHGSRVAVVASF
jgi:hypothetical protein